MLNSDSHEKSTIEPTQSTARQTDRKLTQSLSENAVKIPLDLTMINDENPPPPPSHRDIEQLQKKYRGISF